SRKQHEALVRLIYSGAAGEAMSWLQNPRMQAPDQRFNQFCQRRVHAPHGHGSFITGSVTPPLPHIGDAMAAQDPLWALPHAVSAVAMSRRYDRTQKTFILQSLRRAYADMAYPGRAADPRAGEATVEALCARVRAAFAAAQPGRVPRELADACVLACRGVLER
ncbi:hypothetical protein EG859_15225, partial [Enterococcus faecalis]